MSPASTLETRTETLLAWYRSMCRIRLFEERVQTLFAQGLVRGSTHLAIGQEAVAVGAAAALRPGDKVLCTYRGHHHCLAGGMDLEGAFAEILGRRTGVCGGRGGSMHLTDVSNGLYGSYAIVGSHLPIAVGMAWAVRLQGLTDVIVTFFGDGTTTIGAFHEALNLAAVWSLPVIFICENNRYSEYTPIDDVSPVKYAAADRSGAYGLPRIITDGNDVTAVWRATTDAVSKARSGKGPSLIEAETYRHGGHSRSDPGTYRPAEEVKEWLARDPIPAMERQLIERLGDRQQVDAVTFEVEQAIDEALTRALAAPPPDPSTLHDHVFASGSLQ